MTERFTAQPALEGLTDFQRRTVAHIMDRYFGECPTRRFLTADETGLGKSLVARGVIASLIERLQDNDDIDRIDIVYVCSNADIAEQNLTRLNVTGEDHLPFASRLTLLAKESHRLTGRKATGLKPVNLVSFTPGTSFDTGSKRGRAEERGLLFLLLSDLLALQGPDRRRLRVLMRYGVQKNSFDETVYQLRAHLDRHGPPDEVIVGAFRREIARAKSNLDHTRSLRRDVELMIKSIGRRQEPPRALSDEWAKLIGGLRGALAKASIDSLEPDLVILDEFQRFRHLLDKAEGGPAAELAHDLFDHAAARVLLLSATPYKPFTYAEERAVGEDHRKDFLKTLRFLAGDEDETVGAISLALDRLREAAIGGTDPVEATTELHNRLLRLLCRTERPLAGAYDMLDEPPAPADRVDPSDLVDLAALKAIARHVDAPFAIEYWKSAPYFVNFLDGYRLGSQLRDALESPREAAALAPLLRRTHHLDRADVERGAAIDPGNARLRRLLADTVDRGWWQLLWIPPSLPYLEPSGPYAGKGTSAITKRLVFSSWAATPTAVAALVSHEAQRHLTSDRRTSDSRTRGTRLDFRIDGQRPAAMSTLVLFWPNETLARRTDPLDTARGSKKVLPASVAIEQMATALADLVGPNGASTSSAAEAWYWLSAFRLADSIPRTLTGDTHHLALALSGALPGIDQRDAEDVDAGESNRLGAHLEQAIHAHEAADPEQRPVDLVPTIASLGAHGPGNIAWRALARQLRPGNTVTPAGHWNAAATIASGFRSLFNRADVTALLDRLYPDQVYWRAVLAYCAAGNLQSTLDEYVHHLVGDRGPDPLTDDAILKVAEKVRSAIAMRPAPYTAFDPFEPVAPITFSARFALRYGNKRQTEGDVRQPAIRNAFNSPFWPFVLATTSVGQEGIDLHWWCHAAVHWNTPASPVDFDQREGRVHRYGGHAIRKNIASTHRKAMLSNGRRDPWEAGYGAATEHQTELGDITPHWVYPGPAKVLRITNPYPLSIDRERLQRLKDDVALYRLTLGQPRQEDMLDILRRHGVQSDPARARRLRLDLTPPPLHPDVPTTRSASA